MAKIKAFGPPSAPTPVAVAPAAASAATSVPGGGETLRVFNPTAGTVFLRVGTDNTVVAAATDYPIPAGADRLIDIGTALPVPLFVSIFQPTGGVAGTVFVMRGDGSSQ